MKLVRLNLTKFSITAGINLDRTHIHLDTAIRLLGELYIPNNQVAQIDIFKTHLPSLYLCTNTADLNLSSMIMLSSVRKSHLFDAVTGFKLVCTCD